MIRQGRNIALTIAYDGTGFSGWQRQNGRRTVQAVIEDALARLHKHALPLAGSGRTDAGVHALFQVANFYSDIAGMEAERFIPALNSLLPHDVRIMAAKEAPPEFHARFSAESRTYRYYFICRRGAFPWERRFACQLRRQPDIGVLNDYARLLRGEMDCGIFAAAADRSASRFRRLYNAVFFIEDGRLVFEIRANAFLWNMVRSLAGTLLYYEEKKTPAAEFLEIIRSGKRELAGPTLPPQGLFLYHIEYGNFPLGD